MRQNDTSSYELPRWQTVKNSWTTSFDLMSDNERKNEQIDVV